MTQLFCPFFQSKPTASFNNAGTLRKSAGSGTTTFSPRLNNSGLVDANAGTLSLGGGFTPLNGELRFGLTSRTNFGKISIAGSATLGGTVGVQLLGGYVPATNTSFAVLTYGSYTGLFTGLDLPPVVRWATNYAATSFTLSVAASDKLAFTTQPAGGIPNAILPPVVVQVQQAVGTPVATNGVPITLALASGSGSLSGMLIRNTDATGKATFDNLSLNVIGNYALRATSPDLTYATSLAFNIFPVFYLQPTNGGALVTLTGTNDLGAVVLYASTDLKSWIPIYTNLFATNAMLFLDTAATNYSRRFYHPVKN